MRKTLMLISLLFSPITCISQVTPLIGLNLPVYSSPNWNVPLNQNFTILDNYLGGVNSFPNPLKASITGTAANMSGGALGSVPYQSATNVSSFVAPNTTTSNLFLCEQGTGVVGAAPTWCSGSGSVSSFSAPSGSWPTWLVPTVTNSTTNPSLAVAASAIPNSALANASTTVNGTSCTLGSTCTVAAAAGTLTGSTLAAGVTGSSLTSVGTITTGVWQGSPIANSWLANNYTTVNGQVCTLGGSCVITTGSTANLAGGSLGSVPYQVSPGFTSFVSPNTTTNTYYLCETGTGSVGASPAWCNGSGGGSGTVTSVGLSMPSTQFTISGSPVTTSGTFTVTLNSPTGSGAIVLATSPALTTPNIGAAIATGISLSSGGSGSNCWSTNGSTAGCGLPTPSAANLVPVSIGSGPYSWSTLPLLAGGTNIITGPSSAVSSDIATFSISGGILDSGVTIGTLARLASPAFSGTPTAPTAATGTNSTQIATAALVLNDIANVGSVTFIAGSSAVLGSGGSYSAPACDASYTCTGVSGIVDFTTGNSPSSSGGIFSISFGTPKSSPSVCVYQMITGASISGSWPLVFMGGGGPSTTSNQVNLISANPGNLTANQAYSIEYICGR
jgi:hypothetical protein